MKFKKIVTCFLAAAIAAGGVMSGTTANYSYLRSGIVSAAVSVPTSATVLKESAYVTWDAISGADGYNVYIKPEGGSYTQLDSMLIRQYNSYFRADALGLKAGKYVMKVVPTSGGKEDTSKAIESVAMTVEAHERTGFGFVNGTSSGAYNDDGTLKSDAVVLYVTEATKDTVSMEVTTSSKGATTACTGIQNILDAYKKGYETRPLCVRFIGNVTDPAALQDGDILVKGSSDSSRLSCGVTLEGVGADATLNGFGVRVANASNVEIRNLGFMNCNSGEGDDCGLQQSNDHVWVHNCDFFYGDAGSDADQVKGDGALDTKTSSYVTHSYNHFWDNGKCNLQGMKSESTDNYITYHHNWYDHSDSRHPRIRTCSVHSYNNYFDGNAKYGIGVTMGASAFSENNYFRNCKYPMLISMQGNDIDPSTGKGTFSSEDGGVIKSYGDYMTGQKAFTSYQDNNTEFDAYVASSKTEQVPSSVTAKQGGTTYNNFDTSSIMYSYTADATANVPTIVMAEAGRVDGGDFQWTFDNSVDDESYAVNEALKAALISYDDSIVAIGSGFTQGGNTDPTQPTTTVATTAATTKATTVSTSTTTKATTQAVIVADAIYCSPTATSSGKGTKDSPIDVLSALTMVQPGGTIYLLGGTYKYTETILIEESNSGSAGKFKTIMAYPGETVKFDFTGQEVSGSARGFVLDGDYWHFYGFEITNAGDNGMLLSGNNNKIEMMIFNDNEDTGLQISRYNTNAATIAEWPTNNLVLNCTSKNNCDEATMENADGFAAKLTCGEGNVFDGCMAYNNSDDGWDLFAKEETGPIGVVTIQNCVAFRNGFTEDGRGYGDCDGNGFKLGGSGVGTGHIVKNCLAFENLNCGFTDNNNPKLESLTDCTSYNNGVGANDKPNFSCYRCTDDGCDFTNIMSYINTDEQSSLGAAPGVKMTNDKFVGTIQNSIYYNSKYYMVSDRVAIDNGDKTGDIIEPAVSDFITLSVPSMGTDFHTAWRNADGSINTAGFVETTGTYASMGYHFTSSGPVVPPTTTVVTTAVTGTETTVKTTVNTTAGTTAVTPVSTGNTQVAGNHIHNFTLNGTESTYYTIVGNLSTGKGTVEYNGLTLTQCLKMESSTSIKFTAAADGKLTLVFVETAATVNVDGTKYTSGGDGIITVDLKAGAHTVTKADTANLFYMSFVDGTGEVVTTPATTPVSTVGTTVDTTVVSTPASTVEATVSSVDTTVVSTPATTVVTTEPVTEDIPDGTMYGDVTGDMRINVADVVAVNMYLLNPEVNVLTMEQKANADCARDKKIDTSDSALILNYVSMLASITDLGKAPQ